LNAVARDLIEPRFYDSYLFLFSPLEYVKMLFVLQLASFAGEYSLKPFNFKEVEGWAHSRIWNPWCTNWQSGRILKSVGISPHSKHI